MSEKLTIQDIARLAGVSKATVSRVLNKKPDVELSTRERILRIIKEQNFTPSITASGLAGGRNCLIGVLIPALTWPLVPELMRGVAQIVEGTPYELVLYSISTLHHEDDRSKVIDRILTTNLIAGLLAVYPGQSVQHLLDFSHHGLPVVLLDDQYAPPTAIPWVGIDNRKGAYTATSYLLQSGHRRIAHIQGPMKYKVSQDRYLGYCDALREAGIECDPTLVLEGDFMPEGGSVCADQLFSRAVSERPSAIFAGNDFTAHGVMFAAEKHNLRIPQDVALIGFDDTPPYAEMQRGLTTVRQPFCEMGQRAMALLLELIKETRAPYGKWHPYKHDAQSYFAVSAEPIRIEFSTSLIVRASCGAL